MNPARGTTHRPLARGDIVLVPFPFTDLSTAKRRPAVVVATDPAQIDFTLAFISSQNVGSVVAGEMALLPAHPEFGLSGLSVASRIRATKLVTLSRSLISRWVGRLGPLWIADLDRTLVAALAINTTPFREAGRLEEQQRLRSLHASGGTVSLLAELRLPHS